MIVRQGHPSQENGSTSEKENYVLWFNKTKCVKLGQRIYRMAFGVNPLFPSIYRF
jgi:hypothetical protein